jgi:superfamily II DNA or RNA helicase
LKRTLDGLSGAEFVSTVALSCGLWKCPQKMCMWRRQRNEAADNAADFLFEHDRALILAPVGAGKTALTLTAMFEMLVQGHAQRFLSAGA